MLVDSGVYKEEVTVTTPSIVIRGVDRNATIIDGEFVRGNGIAVYADQVAVENLTARNAVLNGFFWTGVTGFRGRYLTAYNNGDYGVYAFGATDGLFEDSYASGSPDSGFYVGECYPCRIVIRRVIAEHNALGYSGTNSGGELYVVSSVWRNNRVGLVPATLDIELVPPQREATFAANLVTGNSSLTAPAAFLPSIAFGSGFLIGGGVRNVVERNVIADHVLDGIAVISFLDRNFWPAEGNIIRNNRILRSGRADLALGGPASRDNCFSHNEYQSSAPAGLELLAGCNRLRLPMGHDPVALGGTLFVRAAREEHRERPSFKTQPVPPPQPQMPGGATAPVEIAAAVFDSLHFRVDDAQLPPEAAQYLAAPAPEGFAGPGSLGVLFGRWSYHLLWILLLLWVGLALWDLRRRRNISRGGRLTWGAASRAAAVPRCPRLSHRRPAIALPGPSDRRDLRRNPDLPGVDAHRAPRLRQSLMPLGRREWLRLGAVGAAGVVGGWALGRRKSSIAGAPSAGHEMSLDSLYSQGVEPPPSLGPLALEQALRPPPFVAGPVRTQQVELRVEETMLEVARGRHFSAWTYNGTIPGPVIRATEGDALEVHFQNRGAHPHNVHFHGTHDVTQDGWEPVPVGGEATYRFRAEPFGLHPYHCHALPVSEHMGHGLYGAMIVDPRGGRPPAEELVLVLSGFDLDGDGRDDLYGWNGVAGYYARNPIKVPVGKLVRLYLLNLCGGEPLVSFHLHAQSFELFRSGTSLVPEERTDTVTLGPTERAVLEFRLPVRGRYMFQPHQHHLADRGATGWIAAV